MIFMNSLKKAWHIYLQDGFVCLISRLKDKRIKSIRATQTTATSSSSKYLREYDRFDEAAPFTFEAKSTKCPLVSIIIPVYNNYLYTYNCLKSLNNKVNDSINFEIIVVDDASVDETSKMLEVISGISVIINQENLGFIRSCNIGASEAKGQFLCFLNNDTRILDGWLENLLSAIEEDETVGAVGSKLIYPDGRLQEAGGIIWQDASGWNYGRFNSPDEPEYNYVREVDYCSGASLLVRKELFQSLGGFSETFVPAYYEDTDVCFSIRKLGYKVLYQPKSEIIHYEGVTSGTSIESGVKKYQEVNREKFRFKWQNELSQHFVSSGENADRAARRLQGKYTILVIDSYVPLHDRESGSCRLFNIIKIFKKLGYSLIFLPDNGHPEEPYTSSLQRLGVEVLYCTEQQPNLQKQLKKRLPLIDAAWVCRPEICEKYLHILRRRPEIKVIYDTVDLHFVRLKRECEISPRRNKLQEKVWKASKTLEVSLAKLADVTVVVTEVEKNVLSDLGVKNIWIVPNIHQRYSGSTNDFHHRNDLLFIGNYSHTPNVDAVIWLCQEIMPLVWASEPSIKLTILGNNPPPQVKSLASERVKVTGYIKDVEPYFLASRLFVAPLRFGAGMKGKIGQSLSYGLPTVTTSIGAEGMNLTDKFDVMIADEAEIFARCIVELYKNPNLWSYISENAFTAVRQYTPESVQPTLASMI